MVAPATGHAAVLGDIAVDLKRGQIVLLGGAQCHETSTTCPGQTWILSGSFWTRHSPSTIPDVDREGSGCWHADYSMNRMVFDSVSGNVVLLGLNALWAWDGKDWMQVEGSSLPPDLIPSNALIAFDDSLGKLVVVSTDDLVEP